MKTYLLWFILLFGVAPIHSFAQEEETDSMQFTYTSLGFLHLDKVPYSVTWPSQNQEGLSVMWWNIGRGNIDVCTPNGSTVLEHNLIQILLSEHRPKVLVFGEYLLTESCLSQRVLDLIHERYNTYQTRYTKKNPIFLTFGVFVDKSIQLETYKELELKWYPTGKIKNYYKKTWEERCKVADVPAEYMYFDRTFPQLDLTIDGKKLSIIPVHYLMPWICYKKSWEHYNKVGFANYIMYAETHPVYYQARDLTTKITDDMENVVILGDWNLPTTLYDKWVWSNNTYDLFFNLGFKDMTTREWGTYSFPSSFNPEKIEDHLLLDHVLARGNADIPYASILPIQGSDHYPLLTYIKMK